MHGFKLVGRVYVKIRDKEIKTGEHYIMLDELAS